MRLIWLIGRVTYLESLRNRWVLFFSVTFALLAFLLSYVGASQASTFSSFDRSSATLLHILLIFIPLLGFMLGAQLIAGDREGGALVYLLSHPVGKNHIYFGKLLGALMALSTSLTTGFAFAAIGISLNNQESIQNFIILWIASEFFLFITLSIGMCASVLAQNRGQAIGIAIVAWLIFTIFSDLGLMGTSYVLGLRSEGIVGLALLNPVEVFKIFVIRILSNNLEVLGAGGMYLDLFIGKWLPLVLGAWLFVMAIAALVFSHWLFQSQEEY